MKIGVRKVVKYKRKCDRKLITKSLTLQTGKTDKPRNEQENKEYQEFFSIAKKSNVIYTTRDPKKAVRTFFRYNNGFEKKDFSLLQRAKRISVFFNIIN